MTTRRVRWMLTASLLLSFSAGAQIDCRNQLIGGNQNADLFTIDIATGSASLIGTMPIESTEIEWDVAGGNLYAEESDGGTQFHRIDPMNAGSLGSVTHPCCALNGLEFIGGTLYGTNITGGGGMAPSDLVILDPTTGTMTTIGPTGFGPIAGLAYDEFGGVLYGITGGGMTAQLVTIDIATGAATAVGSTGLDRIGSLEFGPDGQLYAGLTGTASSLATYLVRIDPMTAAVTPVGATGFPITGLTACAMQPAPVPAFPIAGLGLLGAALSGAGIWRLRRRTVA